MGKKALCLIFAFLLSINSFAAVVSDNDGSAFITKAEFDSLKNNFQAQLDSYNSNIDSKIDSAIASYLAGIKTSKTESFDPFVLVNSTSPKIVGRAHTYGNITQQFYNEISAVMTNFGCSGGAITTNNPMTIAGTNEQSFWWQFWVQPLTHLKNYGRGYEFDANGCVTSIYGNDNIVINLTFTDSSDPYGDVRDIGSWFNNNGFSTPASDSNFQLNIQYLDRLNPANARVHHEYTTAIATVRSNYNSYLACSSSTGSHWYGPDTDAGRWTNLTNSFYATHRQEDRETDISMYNKCDNIVIYAYPEGSTYLENLVDINSGASSLTVAEKCYQLMTYNGDASNILAPYVVGKSVYDTYGSGRNHRHLYSFPKLKLANRTTINEFKPNKRQTPAGGNQFNTLDQFYNGYMKYKVNKIEYSPKFYEGIPLFCFDKDAEKVTFKIKAKTTTSGKTQLRLYFKSAEFPNEIVDTSLSVWSSINPRTGAQYKNEIIKATSKTLPNNTEIGLQIASNVEETITLTDIKANMPYFMRFVENTGSGTTASFGGQIIQLNEFTKTLKND